MENLTPTEYDRYVRQFGVRAALTQYPFTMSYRYAGQLAEHPDHTMFYASERDREQHARALRALGGKITGASGGNTNLY
jgi:hypothetical protein